MEWSGFGAYPTIGFNAFGDYYDNHLLTGQPAANDIACLDGRRWTNEIYQLSISVEQVQQTERAECRKRYFEDIQLFGGQESITTIALRLQPCPCSVFQVIFDFRFQFDIFSTTNDFCFYQRFPSAFGAAQYCCYSSNFFLFGALVTSGSSGSSMLRFHPNLNSVGFQIYDREFRDVCCGLAGLCDLFYERRPVDFCFNYQPLFWSTLN